MAELYGRCMFNFLRKLPNDFPKWWPSQFTPPPAVCEDWSSSTFLSTLGIGQFF